MTGQCAVNGQQVSRGDIFNQIQNEDKTMKKQSKTVAAAAKTNKPTMTDKQKELKRQRDARYRAKKRAEKAAKAKPEAPKAKPCKCQGKKSSHKVAEIHLGTSVPKGMEPIFTSFMQHVITGVGKEFAALLSGFDGALRDACKSEKKDSKPKAKAKAKK